MVCAAVLAAGGCGGPVRAVSVPVAVIPESRPADFTLAVTVLGPARGQAEGELPRSLTPGRYIVETDGSLRVSLGAGATARTYPPRTRQLTPRQMDLLWTGIRDSGLLDPGHPGRINWPEDAVRSADRTTSLFYVGHDGGRTTVRVLLDRTSEGAVAAERVVDRLAELGWVR